MKVLLTGATGFVGRHVVHRLLERGHEVTVVLRSVATVPPLRHEEGRTVCCNIDADLPEASMAMHDVAMHLAWPGLPNYDGLFHFESALPAHYQFIKRLLELGLPRVLVAGTCFEYGMRSGCLSESDAPDPANPYAIAKDSLRRFLVALQMKRPFTLQWARLFYMHGPGQRRGSLMGRLDEAMLKGQVSFEMTRGEQLRDYLPVEEAARSLVTLLEHPEAGGVTNICSGVPVSVRQLAEQRIKEAGSAIRLSLGALPYSPHEPMAFWGDNRRFAAFDIESPAIGR